MSHNLYNFCLTMVSQYNYSIILEEAVKIEMSSERTHKMLE
jgi:hypothetical protein